MTRTIIHSVTVFDGLEANKDLTVIFDDRTGLIESISPSSNVSKSTETDVVVDGKDHTLIPGLIDAHVHVHKLHVPDDGDPKEITKQPLRAGVTTVCDMHGMAHDLNQHWQRADQEVAEAKKLGPSGRVTVSDVKTSLLAATIKGGWPKPIVLGRNPSQELQEVVETWPNVTKDTAEDYVRTTKEQGAHYIKLMQEDCCCMSWETGSVPSASLELQQAVVNAAHKHDLKAYAHATSIDNTIHVLKAGVDGLTHTFCDQPPTQELVDLYKETGACLMPTLAVTSTLTGEAQDDRDKFADFAIKRGVIDETTRNIMLGAANFGAPSSKLQYAWDSVRVLKQAGIDIVAGTDASLGLKGTAMGASLWMELSQYVAHCGLTPAEALSSATAVSARRFGFEDRGEVKVGKRADLVLVKGEPHVDIEHLWTGQGITSVWKRGIRAG
ncbi:unnamed protein product [Clonostachys rosea]|uniref:Amidohydrolase-related domain-containing protein n=1 Tax=Bionectria ochroleuca TaxID=29856 RepID=A0ABY6UK77_BIOOC|nr:unnamed protein product [Clonostachys rosea]